MTNRTLLTKVYWWALQLFVFTIPLSQFVSVRLMIASLLLSFFVADLPNAFRRVVRNSAELFVYMGILLLGLLLTDDLETGLDEIETSFSIVAVPLTFLGAYRLGDNRFSRLVWAFVAGVACACAANFANALYQYGVTKSPSVFFYSKLMEFTGHDPTYMAYYLIFCITFLLFVVFYEQTVVPKFAILGSVFFLFASLMLTSGKTAFLSLLLVFSFFALKYILENRDRNKHAVFVTVMVLLVALFAVSSAGSMNERWTVESDTWERSILWRSAVHANPAPITGVGTGGYKDVLNDYYRANNMPMFADASYNAHNQYIQLYFSHGLIGLLVILTLLSRPLYQAMKNQSTIALLSFFPFVIYGITEVFLGRYQGVVFFALVHQLLVLQFESNRKEIFRKTS